MRREETQLTLTRVAGRKSTRPGCMEGLYGGASASFESQYAGDGRSAHWCWPALPDIWRIQSFWDGIHAPWRISILDSEISGRWCLPFYGSSSSNLRAVTRDAYRLPCRVRGIGHRHRACPWRSGASRQRIWPVVHADAALFLQLSRRRGALLAILRRFAGP